MSRKWQFEVWFSLIWLGAMALVFLSGWMDLAGGTAFAGRLAPVAHGPSRVRMAVTETTVAQYCRYLNGAADRSQQGHPQCRRRGGRMVPNRGQARRPVSHVSFDDALAYCRWVSDQTGLVVRLPTEEEWAVAAAGGDGRRKFPWGWGDPKEHAWYGRRCASNVAAYRPNAFGLHDMAGNVFEWCRFEVAPSGPTERRVVRGGSWAETDSEMLAVAARVLLARDYRDADVGFRVVAEVPRP